MRRSALLIVICCSSLALATAAGCGDAGTSAHPGTSGGDDYGGGYGQAEDASSWGGETGSAGDTGDSGDWGGYGDEAGWGASADATASSGPDPSTGSGGSGGVSPEAGPGVCDPNCEGKQCGPDGCGGSCGWCGGFDSCQSGACVVVDGCEPACAGQMIGVDDGCGGVCTGSGMGIGLAPGGAQDAGYFKKLVLEGEVPSPDVLPIEGWLNEHGTPLPPPETDRLVTVHGFAGLFYDPTEGEPMVALQIGLNSGLQPEVIEDGHFNLCIVVDRSGSMDGDDRIGFVKTGLKTMLSSLDEHDTLSIVTYADQGTVLVAPQAVSNPEHIADLIDSIEAAGSTNLHDGLKLGYEQVMLNAADNNQIPRVILLSDGVVTKGIEDPIEILAMSAQYNDLDIGLTTIGVGVDFDFDLMHDLALQGLGNFYFLDSAEKLVEVFRDEIEYLLTPVADNLKISFSLPEHFGVDDVYGFDFSVGEDGAVHVLAPSPQYTIDEEDPDDPHDTPDGGEGDDGGDAD